MLKNIIFFHLPYPRTQIKRTEVGKEATGERGKVVLLGRQIMVNVEAKVSERREMAQEVQWKFIKLKMKKCKGKQVEFNRILRN